jgi:Uma2 family endonuclease
MVPAELLVVASQRVLAPSGNGHPGDDMTAVVEGKMVIQFYTKGEGGLVPDGYCHGEVFAMAGGSPRHNFLSGAMVGELRTALRGTGCQVLTADQRISAEAGERYVYADAVATSGGFEAEPGTSDVLANPRIVVEVLSRSTEAYDRGDKWEGYQQIPSLMDYLLVSQTAAQIEHYQRDDHGRWWYTLHKAGHVVTLSNGATLAVDAIYEGAFPMAAS